MEKEEKESNQQDTIPTSLKRDFFENKAPPCIIKDYDVVGFSVDHCLVKYNMFETVKLAVEAILLDLYTNFKYPEEVLRFDYDKNLNIYLTNVVWDLKHGTMLKLGDDRVITRAVLGYESLTDSQIISLYGDPPTFENLKFFKDSRLETKHPHWTLSSPVDCYKIPVILHITQLIRQKKVTNKTIDALALDLREVDARQFISFTPEKVNKVSSHGLFYPKLFKQEHKYILSKGYGQEAAKIIQKLRKKGKGIFCVSDGHVDWTIAVLEASLGPDWLDLFDLVICNAKRPLFSRTEQPFFTIDYGKDDLRGSRISNIDQLLKVEAKILTEGNARLVTNYYQKKKGKYNLNFAFVGRDYQKDIQSIVEFDEKLRIAKWPVRWEAIAIVEEFIQEDRDYENWKNSY